MLRGAKNTVQGAKMAFGTPFLATPLELLLDQKLLSFIPPPNFPPHFPFPISSFSLFPFPISLFPLPFLSSHSFLISFSPISPLIGRPVTASPWKTMVCSLVFSLYIFVGSCFFSHTPLISFGISIPFFFADPYLFDVTGSMEVLVESIHVEAILFVFFFFSLGICGGGYSGNGILIWFHLCRFHELSLRPRFFFI